MKKAMIIIMISITAAFLFTMLGVFIGRMTKDGVVTISSADSVRKETVEMEETISLGLININTATAEQLQELPGIGESIANEIIKYREENGPFTSKRDIMKVKGIGEKLYDQLKSMITTKD